MGKTMERPFGLYIHIPFCVRKCRYCDFLSAPADAEVRHAYASALCGEIRQVGTMLKTEKAHMPVCDTIFIGGGTPTTLDPSDLAMIMDCIYGSFFVLPDAEITMEMNPGTYSNQMLSFAGKYLNRVSIGLQSAQNEELLMLGRIHTYEDFEMCYEALRGIGISNINVDLMSGIPGQTLRGWEETLLKVTSLEPDHISAYSLIVEEGTPFYELNERGELDLPDEDTEREMYRLTETILSRAGYKRYEISNYAKEGRACRHNTRYWKREPYLGFGIGAASLYGKLTIPAGIQLSWKSQRADDLFNKSSGQYRRTNTSDLKAYIERCGGTGSKAWEKEVPEDGSLVTELTIREAIEEYMFLGLRMTEGISKQDFYDQFGMPIDEMYGKVITSFIAEGLLKCRGNRIFLTERGLDLGNTVMAEFLLD